MKNLALMNSRLSWIAIQYALIDLILRLLDPDYIGNGGRTHDYGYNY